ncbi:MAG TPA: NAD(P)-dependent oxidoreductase [Bacteroidia bacterium]
MNLVTGYSGFLAGNLISKLQSNELILSGRKNNGNTNFIGYDELMNRMLKFQSVFHLAAYIPQKNEINTDRELYLANIELCLELTEKLEYEKFVYASSVSVYGQPLNMTIDEDSIINSPSVYGISKLWAEKIVQRNNNHSIIRFSSIYGEGMNESTMIPNYVNQSLKEGVITVWGDGRRLQNYIHVSDASDMLIRSASSKSNGTFLGTGIKSYSNLEVAEMIAEITGAKIEFKGEDHSNSVTYNNSKSQEILEWSPKIEMRTGLLNYIEWKQKQF